MTVRELREKRASLHDKAQKVIKAAESENRSMTAEENQKVDRILDDMDAMKKDIDRRERVAEEGRSLDASEGRKVSDSGAVRTMTGTELRSQMANEDQRYIDFQLADTHQLRSLSTGTDTAGGHLTDDGFIPRVEKALLSGGGMREAASVFRTTDGNDLPHPTMDDTAAKATIIGEGVAASERNLTFGQKVFKAWKYTSDYILVSQELLEDSAVDVAGIVIEAIRESFNRGQNEHYTTGDGTTQPEGLITAAQVGVTAASSTAVTWEELVDLEHSVNSVYRRGGKFMFADTTLRELKKLSDNDGNPLWLPGVQHGEPDKFLGYEYIINDDVPAFGLSAKSIAFGRLDKHKIRDVRGMRLKRLNEKFALEDSVAFVAFMRTDSRLLDAGTNPVQLLQMSAT